MNILSTRLHRCTMRICCSTGTLPVKSREEPFYYGHKQNRFWKVMGRLCGEPVPETIEEKKEKPATGSSHCASDVIQSCDIKVFSDSKHRNVEADGYSKDPGGIIYYADSMPTVTKQESFIENISCP